MTKYTKLLYSLAVLIITFVVYAITAAPDVTFTDSGELASVCTTLGTAHPTGYPLFTIIGFLWTLLPLPFSAVYKLNLMAAFTTSFSAVVFMHTVFVLLHFVSTHKYMKSVIQDAKKRKHVSYAIRKIKPLIQENYVLMLSFIMALVYGFSQTVWKQAIAIEVYSLHLLMINLILYVFLKAVLTDDKTRTLLILTAFLIGLSFTNHMTTILLLPAILFLYFKRPGELFIFTKERFSFIAYLLIPFFVGLSIYLYLPIRSFMDPLFDWGEVSRGLDKFIYHVGGKQYQVWMFTGENLGSNLGLFFSLIPNQLAWIGIIPVFYGLHRLFTASRSLFGFLILLIFICLLYAINYSIHDIDSYFLTGYVAIILIAAVGIYELLENMNNKERVRFIVPAHILLAVLLLLMNYKENDHSDNYLVPEYTRIMGDNLEKDAIIFSAQWDFWCSAFWYKQQIEGYRPDVVMVEKELLRRTWYPTQLLKWYPEVINKSKTELDNYLKNLELFESGKGYDRAAIQRDYLVLLNSIIEKNIDSRPIYITPDLNQATDDNFYREYVQLPQGLAIRLLREDKYIAPDFKKLNFEKFIASIKDREDHLEKGIQVNVANFVAYTGAYCYNKFNIEEAKKLYDIALAIDPKNQAAIQGKNAIRDMN